MKIFRFWDGTAHQIPTLLGVLPSRPIVVPLCEQSKGQSHGRADNSRVGEFRKHPGRAFELVKSGQPVAISYRGELFDIVLREDDELEITPELLEAIRESREQYARGEYISFKTHEELQA